MFKNVASQKVIVFAFDSTTNTPKTGDAANISAYISKDFGSVTQLTDTSATEMDSTNAKGYYLFDISQTETNADLVLVSGKSSTSNIVVIGAPAAIFTLPANFTASSIDSSGRVDVIKINGTSQTARDIGASVLLSAGTGTGQLDFTSGVVKANVTQFGGTNGTFASGRPEVNTTHWSGTANATPDTAGYPKVTIKSGTGTGELSITSGIANVNASKIAGFTTLGSGNITFPGTIASTTNITAASGVALGSSQTFNMTGDITGNLSGSVGSVSGAVGSVTGNVGGNVTGSVGSLDTQAKADVNAEVVDALNVDTYAQPGQAAPPATTTIRAMVAYLYKGFRNKHTQTATGYALYNDDAATVDQKATVSDDGTTFTRGEIASGP